MSINKKLAAIISVLLCFAILLCACNKTTDVSSTASENSSSNSDFGDVNSDNSSEAPSDDGDSPGSGTDDPGDDDNSDPEYIDMDNPGNDDRNDLGNNGGNSGNDAANSSDNDDRNDSENDNSSSSGDDEPDDSDDSETVLANVKVDLSKPLSESYVNSALYLGWGYFPDSANRTYTQKEITAELDRIKKMGYTHVRTSLNTGWVADSYDRTAKDWDWNGEKFQRFVWVLKELEKRGVTVTMTINWDMETDLKSNGIYVANNYETTCSNYAEYGYRLLTKLKESGVNNVTQLLPFTEPYPSKKLSVFTDKYTNEIWRDTVKALHDKLTAEGVRKNYKIVGPCTSILHIQNENLNAAGFTEAEWAEWYVKNCNSFVDIYAYHLYSNYSNNVYSDTYQLFYDAIEEVMTVFKNTGKQVCFDEYDYQYKETSETQESTYLRYLIRNVPFYATQSVAALIAVINSGADMAARWSLFDTIFPDSTATNTAFDGGIQVTGVAPVMNQTSVPYYAYYANSLISRYFSGASGTKTYKGIDDGDGVYLTASRQPDGTFTVLAINLNLEETKVTFNFSESLGKATLYRHKYDPAAVKRTTAAHVIGVDKVYKNVTNHFIDTLPAGAVVVYTTDATDGMK